MHTEIYHASILTLKEDTLPAGYATTQKGKSANEPKRPGSRPLRPPRLARSRYSNSSRSFGLLLLCFPLEGIAWMVAAVYLGAYVPLPRVLRD